MVNPNPGDEIITSPITDIGTVIPIIYQNCIPIFADIETHTWNMDAADLESKITDKTAAIIPIHLFGNSADMDPIMEVAQRHKIPVIEDASQAHRSTYKGELVGTIGDIGCFSLQQSKHTYWQYGFTVEKDASFSADEFSSALKKEGIGSGAHYIGKPIFLCQQALVNKTIFGDSQHPFDLPTARKNIEYVEGMCPVTEDILNRMVTVHISQFLEEEDVRDIAKGIRKVAEGLARKY